MPASKKSAQRRAHLLQTTSRLFETQGYRHTCIDQIVHEAGVAKGTFYYYFKSKEDALDAVLEQRDAQSARLLQPIVAQKLPADEKLRRCLALLRGCWADEPALFGAPAGEPLHYKSLLRRIRALAPPCAQILRQGVDEGLFRAPHPAALAEAALTAGFFLLDGTALPTDEEGRRQRAQILRQLLERGLNLPEGSLCAAGDAPAPRGSAVE